MNAHCDVQLFFATIYMKVGIESVYSGLPVTTTVAGYNGATAANATFTNYGKVSSSEQQVYKLVTMPQMLCS
jgi:hypothetical protein